MTKPKASGAARTLHIERTPGATDARMLAELLTAGVAPNAAAMQRFAENDFGALSLTELVAALKESGDAVINNDLGHAVRLLNAQALTLNLMFAELARRAALNMGTHLAAAETYLRLAMKAQSQSRATIETLAAIKNPPVVFVRQANINNGGQQQVNNAPLPKSSPATTRPGESAFVPNELLEEQSHGGTQLDTRTTAAASRANRRLEPVEALNRTTKR